MTEWRVCHDRVEGVSCHSGGHVMTEWRVCHVIVEGVSCHSGGCVRYRVHFKQSSITLGNGVAQDFQRQHLRTQNISDFVRLSKIIGREEVKDLCVSDDRD